MQVLFEPVFTNPPEAEPTQVLPTDEHLLRGADRRKDGLGSLEVLNEVSVFTDLNTRMGLEENNKNLNKDEEIDKTLSKHGV